MSENSKGLNPSCSAPASTPQPFPAGASTRWKGNLVSSWLNPRLSAESSPRVPTIRMALGLNTCPSGTGLRPPTSFHAATRQTSDGGDFWSLLRGLVTWHPTALCYSSAVFCIPTQAWGFRIADRIFRKPYLKQLFSRAVLSRRPNLAEPSPIYLCVSVLKHRTYRYVHDFNPLAFMNYFNPLTQRVNTPILVILWTRKWSTGR